MFKLSLIGFLFLSACADDKVSVPVTGNKASIAKSVAKSEVMLPHLPRTEMSAELEMTINQAVKYQDLVLRLVNIEDSRCATGVSCIWAGQLIVTLDVSNKNGDQQEVKLIRKRHPEIATAFGFNLLLLDVSPHPKKGKVIQLKDQKVSIQIVKQTAN
ncbi:hypothetical protein RS130_17275 [Paraglaciecola aquimarina]|uniref:Lipoprotein n=1 Tax=Paraglaciecola aquimarina TaxID=1235557 RepID=A0ABU3SZH6_9ALTE|nr:hypothetical protein [Paraglaciecola aquimarina]MDU0355424.1 hypothetical protein [Paraglaciecola aquimarina]